MVEWNHLNAVLVPLEFVALVLLFRRRNRSGKVGKNRMNAVV
jgi:hypothetical protein